MDLPGPFTSRQAMHFLPPRALSRFNNAGKMQSFHTVAAIVRIVRPLNSTHLSEESR